MCIGRSKRRRLRRCYPRATTSRTSLFHLVPDPHLGDSSPLESTARVGAVARVPYPLSSVDVVTWTRLTLLHLFFAFFGVNA